MCDRSTANMASVFKEELGKAVKEGFAESEVAAAKKGLLQMRSMMLSEDAQFATHIANFTHRGRTMERSQKLSEDIAAATIEQVNAAFRRWIDPVQFSYFKAGEFTKAAVNPAAARR